MTTGVEATAPDDGIEWIERRWKEEKKMMQWVWEARARERISWSVVLMAVGTDSAAPIAPCTKAGQSALSQEGSWVRTGIRQKDSQERPAQGSTTHSLRSFGSSLSTFDFGYDAAHLLMLVLLIPKLLAPLFFEPLLLLLEPSIPFDWSPEIMIQDDARRKLAVSSSLFFPLNVKLKGHVASNCASKSSLGGDMWMVLSSKRFPRYSGLHWG